MMHFKLRRHGFFTAEVKAGTNHCGTISGRQNQFQYDVTVEGSGELDKRGFVFDQLLIEQYFANQKTVSRSCEWMAHTALQSLLMAIRADNASIEVLRIAVSISASPFPASITMEWRKDENEAVQ